MSSYAAESVVAVRPFTHRSEPDSVIIGDVERQIYLVIPPEGLDILQWLAAGRTVGETARLHEEKYSEIPDLEDFLGALEEQGFLGARHSHDEDARGVRRPHVRWRLQWLSQRTAQRIVGRTALVCYGLVIAVGLALAVDDPGVIPRSGGVLLFRIDFAALTWATLFLALIGVLIHELGHVTAARAAGVPAGIGVGNRLWSVVAETDMTGIWMAPKRTRYVAFAIGAIFDATTASLLIAFIWAARHGWVHPPPWAVLLASGVLLTYVLRVLWQLSFFMRTDVYYAIAAAFNCKNLMADTEDHLHNLMARLRRSPIRLRLDAVPPREMRVIRWFAVLWVLGRFFSLFELGIVVLPVLYGYLYQVFLLVTGGRTRFDSFDFVTIAVITFALDGGGLIMWVRSLHTGARDRRARARHPEAVEPVAVPDHAA